MSHRHPNPFRTDPHPDLSRTIAEVVASKPKKPKGKPPVLPDKWGGREPYVKNDRNPHTTPHKGVDEACWRGYTARGLKRKGDRLVPDCVKEEPKPRTAAEWSAANRTSRETAKALQRGAARFRKRMAADGGQKGKGTPAQPVREGATPCERAGLNAVRRANAADLKEYPGARGARAHARLHTTIGKILKK